MTIFTALASADRAADLADIFRRKAPGHPAGAALLVIAGHLSTAAAALRSYIPPVIDGITVTSTTPGEAVFALMECLVVAEDTPELHLPDGLFMAVTSPITRRRVHKLLPDLTPADGQTAAEAERTRTAIRLIEHELAQPCDPETRYAGLYTLVNLCEMYGRLAHAAGAGSLRACDAR